MYQAMMQEVVDGIVDFGGFSVQSVQGDTRTHLFLKCWKGDSPFCVCIGTFDKFTKFPLGELSSLAGLFSCFAKPVASVATINLPPHLGKALDHSSSAKTSTLNIPVFSFKEFCDVLRTPTSSVLGKADLFGLLDYIVIKLRSAAAEPWILDSTHLRIVSCPSPLYVRLCFHLSLMFAFCRQLSKVAFHPLLFPLFWTNWLDDGGCSNSTWWTIVAPVNTYSLLKRLLLFFVFSQISF